MKSLTSASLAGDHADRLGRAASAPHANPQALFSDFQWFLYKSQNTVYFTAYSQTPFDADGLTRFVAEMVALAPQLTHGFVGARPGEPLPRHLIDAVISIRQVESFKDYPDAWLTPGQDLFESPDLPLFRVLAANRIGGPDEEGRAAMVMIRSSHALLEGSDSALLARSQSAAHSLASDSSRRVALLDRLKYAVTAWLTVALHMAVAHTLSPPDKPMGFASIAIERHRLRVLANRLGVRQRSLMFALVTHALGRDRGTTKRMIACAYTMLDSRRHDADDDFFRVRALDARFRVLDDVFDHVRALDDTVGRIEQKDITRTQFALNATFRVHRLAHRVAPFLYSRRFWRFAGPYDMVLTLVPPHRFYGDMTRGLMEPIYCGSHHPGSNLCTFVPGRSHVTFNFAMETRHLNKVERVLALIEEMEKSLAASSSENASPLPLSASGLPAGA